MPTTPTSPGWPGPTGYLAGEPPWRVAATSRSSLVFSANYRRDLFKEPPSVLWPYSFACPSHETAIIRGFSAASAARPFLACGPFLSKKIRSMNPRLIPASSCTGESSGNYPTGEMGWRGIARWNVPLWQPSAEYWLGVITVTVERTPTNLTFNNEALVRVTST